LCRLGQHTPPASLAITCQSRGESPRLPLQHRQALSPRPREIPVAATASNAPVPRGAFAVPMLPPTCDSLPRKCR
jgi:hypothetical protein